VRKTAFALAALLIGLLPSASNAQLPGGNVFVGYSFTNAYPPLGSRIGLNGWDASLEGKFLPFVGVVADFSGHYGSENAPQTTVCPTPTGSLPGGCVGPTNAIVHEYNYLFGLRGSFSVSKFRPFAEALFGATRVTETATSFSSTDTSFTEALGAGLDYHLIPLLSWRIEADDLHTGNFSISHDNLRLSTGLVLRF